MRKEIAFAVAVLIGLATADAQAMPLSQSPSWSNGGVVLPVRDGCGPFGHRSHYGYCKEDGPEPYGFVRPHFGGYGFEGPPRYGYGGPRPGYGGPHCFVRATEDGPRRFCTD